MCLREIDCFRYTVCQIEKRQRRRGLGVRRWVTISSTRLAAQSSITVGKMQLPLAAAHRLKMALPVEGQRIVRRLRPRPPQDQGPNIEPVDLLRGQLRPAQL